MIQACWYLLKEWLWEMEGKLLCGHRPFRACTCEWCEIERDWHHELESRS